MWEKITDDRALALKPKNLPEIEKELQAAPPRKMVWLYPKSSYKKITTDLKELLINGIASRAWITFYETTSYREETEHYIQYCFEASDKLIHGKDIKSFDDIHFTYGSSEYNDWMKNSFKRKGTFTVIFNKTNPNIHEIFGHLELFVKEDLLNLSEKIKYCRDSELFDKLSEQFLKILTSPLKGIGNRWENYYNLMKKFGLAKNNEIFDSKKKLQIIKNIIPKVNFDKNDLFELSEICEEFTPGVWAAN